MKFDFQVRTITGETKLGQIEASTKEAALEILKSHGFYVVFLEEAAVPFYARRIRFFERISKKEIVLFSRQLAIMFKSEIPVSEMLNTVAKQTSNPLLKEKILEMIEKVEGGTSLSKTFSFYPEIFNPFYINMVKSGEISGKLAEVFDYLANYLEKEYHFQGKIKGAMIYPAIILVVFFGLLFFMGFFILPKFTEILTESGQKIEGLTKIVLGFPGFIKKYGFVLVLFFSTLIGLASYYLKTKEGKEIFDKSLLRIPWLSGFLKKIYLARFALNLSTLISAGLSINRALEITAETIGNEVYKNIILDTNEGVKRGMIMSVFLEKYPKEITPFFIQMTTVGEKTGRLSSSLLNVSDFYQKEVDRATDNLVTIIEPLMIVFLGVIIGGLMFAVIKPIYQLINVF